MKTDSLARRIRFAPPAPKPDEKIVPQEPDLRQWEAISRHGPLPIPYLAHFGDRVSYQKLQKRYTRFFHHGFLSRPPRQFENFYANYSPIIYDLTPKARALLGSRACPMPASRTAPFVHQLMQACFTASIELAHGENFLSREELIDAESLTIELPGSRLIPDDIFAIRQANGKKRFYLLEIDRNTESIERRATGYNTWKKKVVDYDQALAGGLKAAWGIPTGTVLVVTTNETHAANIKSYVHEHSRFADRWQFLVEPAFGLNWRVPKELLKSVGEL